MKTKTKIERPKLPVTTHPEVASSWYAVNMEYYANELELQIAELQKEVQDFKDELENSEHIIHDLEEELQDIKPDADMVADLEVAIDEIEEAILMFRSKGN